MKRIRAGAAGIILALALSACGGPVDESLLPTPVPTFGPERFAIESVIAEPTPVATETEADIDEVAEDVADAVAEEAAAEEAAAEEAVEEVEEPAEPEAEPVAEATPEPTEEPALEEEATDEDALVEEAVEEETLLPTPTPAATPVPEEEATDAEATDEEAIDADAVEEDVTTEDVAEEDIAEEDIAEEDVAQEDVAEDELVDETAVDETATDEAATDEAATEEEAIEEDVVEEEEAGINPDWEGLPEGVLAAMETADAERGQQLSLAQGCVGCHAMNPDQIMAGPTWHNMAQTARTRVEGESAGLYLYNSIMYPNDYIVEGYLPNIMLQIYDDMLDDQQTADIIAYLLTLEGDE